MSEPFSPPCVALVDDPESPLTWWRVTAPFSRLRQHHVPARWALISDASVKLCPDDIVIFPRLFPLDVPEGRHRMLTDTVEPIRRHSAALVYDVDDDLVSEHYIRHHLLTDWGDGKDADAMRRQCDNQLWAMNQCDGITAASEPLAALLRTKVTVPVHVVPNAIDTRWYRSRLAARSLWHGQVTIGWSGGRRPAADFAAMAEAWGRVAHQRSDVRFIVTGDPAARRAAAAQVPADRVHHIEWAHTQDYPMAHQVDIGCCSVEGTPFDLCKTPIKAWEYALSGAAVVATPALYSQDVADGFTGRLAQSADEWESALLALVDDAEQRRHLNANLAARVEQLHSLDGQLQKWPAAWRSIVASRKAVAA